MIEKALEKIQSEIDKNKDDSYVKVVGEYLKGHLKSNPGAAEKLMAPDKTIAKSLNEMYKAAQKKKKGNCAVLTDQEGFDIVLKYFGLDAPAQISTHIPEPISVPKKNTGTDFDVKLEDLL